MTHRDLIAARCHGRKQTRAAHDLWTLIRSGARRGDDPESRVVQAAEGVLARLDAGAITSDRAAQQLAAILAAWRTLR